MAVDHKHMGTFSLAMISVAAVLSLRNYPLLAVYGWSSIAWYLIGSLLFILPLSLATAELASAWPEDGGVFVWVKRAFGEHWGFVAVWCAFSQNLIWYPTVLAFIAAAIDFAVSPTLAHNNGFNLAVMLGVFWLTTGLNLFGTKATARLSNWGTLLGTLLPGSMIILLWFAWVIQGKSNAIPFSVGALVPDLSLNQLPFVASLVLMFAGVEMSGYFATRVDDPQRQFPKSILIATLLILLMSVIPTLALAWVVPAKEIDLNAGIMQALQLFFSGLGLQWLMMPTALLLAFGSMALMTAWMVSPALGLGVIAKAGLLPPMWSHYNKHGVPAGVMMLQAIIGSLFLSLYAVIPSVNRAYWLMSAITTEVLIVMYILIFGALIRLRYTEPERPRPYRIPGGTVGIWLVAGIALVGLVFSAVIGLLPPENLHFASTWGYVGILLLGTVLLAFTPFAFIWLRKPSWQQNPVNP